MKIFNNFNLNQPSILYNKNIFKPKYKSSHIIYKQTDSVCNPQLYKAYYNVSFGKKDFDNSQIPFLLLTDKNQQPSKIVGKIPLDSGETHNLDVDRNIINRFLLSDDGSINQSDLQAFLSIYKTFLQELTKADEEEFKFLINIINDKNKSNKNTNVSYLNPKDEALQSLVSALSAPYENFINSFFNGIENEQLRKDYAIKCLNHRKDFLDEKYTKALSRTICLFSICKTNNGYDFSDLNRKQKLVLKLEYILENYGGSDRKNISDDILNASRFAQGVVDLDFAECLCELITNSDLFLPEKLVSHRSRIIKAFTSLDKSNAKQIRDSLINFSSVFEIDDLNDNFEVLFSNVFNPKTGKFEEKAASLLVDITNAVIEYIEDFPISTQEDIDYCERVTNELITGYFQRVRDNKTGNIKNDCISPQKYLNKTFDN